MNTTITTPAVNPTLPAGWYGTLQDVYDAVGIGNTARYSNLEAASLDANMTRIQAVMTQVDTLIDELLAEFGIARPDPTADGFAKLSQAFGLWVAAKLYKSRGDLETSGDAKGRTNAETWLADAQNDVATWAQRQQCKDITPLIKTDD